MTVVRTPSYSALWLSGRRYELVKHERHELHLFAARRTYRIGKVAICQQTAAHEVLVDISLRDSCQAGELVAL